MKNLFNPINSAAVGSLKPSPPIRAKKDTTLVKQKTADANFPGPNDPYWKQHPLLTEHKDGTIRKWGEDTSRVNNPNLLPKQILPPVSDKAKGYSNSYYPANNQNKGKAIPEIKN